MSFGFEVLSNVFLFTVGPYMVLEFCEVGQLNSWLQQQKNTANEETSEQLCRICYGICKGMLHLESRKVTCTTHNELHYLVKVKLQVKVLGHVLVGKSVCC